MIRHEDGYTWWSSAPLPPEDHVCKPWTILFDNGQIAVERCPCGAIRLDAGGRWMEVNSRRLGYQTAEGGGYVGTDPYGVGPVGVRRDPPPYRARRRRPWWRFWR